MLGYVDQLLISSFMRRIIPIFFLHTQGKNCTCAATVERWRVATPCRQQHRSVWNNLLLNLLKLNYVPFDSGTGRHM
jgi:hypothetical protein